MTPLILSILDRLQGLFRWLGADYSQLRAIVQVKLMMDNRRNYTTLGRYGQQKKDSDPPNNTFLKVLGFYALFGTLLSLQLAFKDRESLFFPLILQFAYVMILCAMTLISDFSSIILDSSDNQIILPRPVSSRTLWLARITHISVYLFAIALATGIGSILVLGYRFGPVAGLLFLFLSLLSAMLMVFLTNLLYLGLMRFISEDKLREIINYVQIVMAIAFYGGYQLIPRLINRSDLSDALDRQWWHYLVPPMWMAGAVDSVLQRTFDTDHLLLIALAILMPVGGIWVMSQFMTGSFTEKLSSLDQDSKSAQPIAATVAQPTRLLDQLAGWFTGSLLERAAFAFAWRIMGRDRKFKLKTYPQLGFGFVYIVFMSVRGGGFNNSEFSTLFSLYFAGLYGMVAQYQLSASDSFKASWLYGAAPIRQPGDILTGALKAIIVKLVTPFYLLVAAYLLGKNGFDKVDDIMLGYANTIVMLLASALLSDRRMPFSVPVDAVNQSNTGRSLLTLVVLTLVGGLHFILTLIPYGVWGGIVLALLVVWLLMRQYQRTNWNQIAMA
ncbi:ABC-2 family transporter permease [Spirosoma rhododendri]|uniref:Uncharacterized protein n=1 Tax=Spirosoma rhododendri TaxID=2728024 RepID=A0A7L5DJ26_9BACT|nr:hypothetical protein [Spirosoma rhododendri]QJD78085.1 hypothetical protein HH216_06375 [Spirosoma rhododendri]